MNRKILNCTTDEITVEGESVKYTINRSANIITNLEIEPKLMEEIEKKLDNLSRTDPRSKGTVQAFKQNLRRGRLSLRDRGGYGWLNSWLYTRSDRSYGRGHDYIKTIETILFGFELGERIWGEQDGARIDPGFDYIFNLASKRTHENFGECPGKE
jgi:hypothetical protein